MAKTVEAECCLLGGCAGTDGNAGERFLAWLAERVEFTFCSTTTSFSIGPRNGPCFLRLEETRGEKKPKV
jgi:hypothetical protein